MAYTPSPSTRTTSRAGRSLWTSKRPCWECPRNNLHRGGVRGNLFRGRKKLIECFLAEENSSLPFIVTKDTLIAMAGAAVFVTGLLALLCLWRCRNRPAKISSTSKPNLLHGSLASSNKGSDEELESDGKSPDVIPDLSMGQVRQFLGLPRITQEVLVTSSRLPNYPCQWTLGRDTEHRLTIRNDPNQLFLCLRLLLADA